MRGVAAGVDVAVGAAVGVAVRPKGASAVGTQITKNLTPAYSEPNILYGTCLAVALAKSPHIDDVLGSAQLLCAYSFSGCRQHG